MSVTFYAANSADPTAIGAIGPNLNNGNAVRILELLGLYDRDADDPRSGETTATDFAGRVLIALATTPDDAGTDTYEVPPPGCQWIECGRPAGYLQYLLAELADFTASNSTSTVFYWG